MIGILNVKRCKEKKDESYKYYEHLSESQIM